ncbi:MAG: hypothetical protein LBE32_08335 [Burkholderiales bacterium]|jgi:hypothetical protein|nr:hypothetical protein [Burkholderiales bacterium]
MYITTTFAREAAEKALQNVSVPSRERFLDSAFCVKGIVDGSLDCFAALAMTLFFFAASRENAFLIPEL